MPTIYSLNVCRLRNKLEKKPTYRHIKKDNIDTACLRGTYVTKDIAAKHSTNKEDREATVSIDPKCKPEDIETIRTSEHQNQFSLLKSNRITQFITFLIVIPQTRQKTKTSSKKTQTRTPNSR